MKKILFVCTGNTCRSPMAEGIFNKLATEKNIDVVANSVGLATITGLDFSENSISVCKEINVDISYKKSTSFNDVDLNCYDKIFCMSQNHKNFLALQCKIDESKIKVLNICDPYMCDIEVYRNCRDEIYRLVVEIIKEYE